MVELLTSKSAIEYDDFVNSQPSSLFYYTNKYRCLLEKLLDVRSCYCIYRNNDGVIEGVLPAFIKNNEIFGNVINSLPYYGSHGTVLSSCTNRIIKDSLLGFLHEYAISNNCVSTTIITSPFESDIGYYDDVYKYTFKDTRIGQLTKLPSLNSTPISDNLMEMFHSKTRNMVRKAQGLSFEVTSEFNDKYYNFLIDTHDANMSQIGGQSKPHAFFSLVRQLYCYGDDYKLYTAIYENEPIASVLLFYYNGFVEYYTPVIVEQYRSMQPLSLLIFHAMQDAVSNGFKWWNWGGTGLTQEGVYRFKKRWGTDDFKYFYYTRILDEKILALSKATLLKEYPYFFVLPFSEVAK